MHERRELLNEFDLLRQFKISFKFSEKIVVFFDFSKSITVKPLFV